jgi:hypothetical protein
MHDGMYVLGSIVGMWAIAAASYLFPNAELWVTASMASVFSVITYWIINKDIVLGNKGK